MKKRLVTALALMFGLGIGATAFAAANPFVDVPAKHWAYDAVNKLAKAGIVDGYGDGTFRGDRTMTRYEMAQIVAKAMARSDKADAETKATIDKLATEFSAEIENLGVRVAKLEKKSDNVKFDGNLRLRTIYQKYSNPDATNNKLTQARYRLGATAEVNDGWNVRALLEGTNTLSESSNTDDSSVKLSEMYAKGKLGTVDFQAGKWMQTSTGDVQFDESAIKGVKFGFGNQLKAQVYYGAICADPLTSDNDDTVLGTELNWAANKNFAMFGTFNQIKSRSNSQVKLNNGQNFSGKNKVNAWEVGASYKFAQDWKVTGIYNETNAEGQNKGYKAEFQYKAIDLQKAGTWQAALGYVKTDANSVYDSGSWVTNIAGSATVEGNGAKGWYVDGAYVAAKNLKIRGIYGEFKATETNDQKDKYARVQAEFFF